MFAAMAMVEGALEFHRAKFRPKRKRTGAEPLSPAASPGPQGWNVCWVRSHSQGQGLPSLWPGSQRGQFFPRGGGPGGGVTIADSGPAR